MSAYSDLILATPNLAGYWRLGETSGTTATDALGVNNLTIAGGVTLGTPGLIAGDADTAMTFDGINGRASKSGVANLASANALTVELWVTPTIDVNDMYVSDGRLTRYRFGCASTGVPYYNMGSADRALSGAGKVYTTGVTGHYVWSAKVEGTNIVTRLYVNGSQVAVQDEGITTLPAWDNGIVIGAQTTAGTTHPAKGVIDEVAIYKAALDATTIADHYAAGIGASSVPIKVKAGGVVVDAAGYKAKVGGVLVDVTRGAP